LTLNFKVISTGPANIRLIDGSVLSNDGNATNVLGTLGSATYNITEDVVEPKPATDTPVTPAATNNLSPNIISSSYPDSNKWYSSRDASFKWSVPAGVTSISTLYSTSPTATPSKVYTPAISGKDFAVDADGISYMHVQFKNSNGWGPTSHFKFQIDSTPPTNLVAALVDGNITSNTDPEIRVTAEDSLSGLSHITFSIDGKESEPYQISDNNIYKLPKSSGGEHLLTVTVFDKAGNKISTTSGYSVKNLPTPLVIDYTRDLDSNDALRVSGTSNPGLYVEISMRDRAGKVFTQTVKVDEDGVWRLVWTGDLDSGVYEMQARAVDDNYSYSEYTPIKVIIIDSIWPTLGLIILTTLLIIISAIGTAWYYFVQYIRLKNKVREAIKENTKK
jgi:hypothetical protein